MLKTVEELDRLADAVKAGSNRVSLDANAAVDALEGFKVWAANTKTSMTERGKTLIEAIEQDHKHIEDQLNELFDRASTIIDMLKGADPKAEDKSNG